MDAKEFKKVTGLDLYNHTHEEWEEWYYKQLKKIAEEDSYTRELLAFSELIINNKEYSTLMRVLESYDTLVKKTSEIKYPKDNKYPFWCYGFGGSDNGNTKGNNGIMYCSSSGYSD